MNYFEPKTLAPELDVPKKVKLFHFFLRGAK